MSPKEAKEYGYSGMFLYQTSDESEKVFGDLMYTERFKEMVMKELFKCDSKPMNYVLGIVNKDEMKKVLPAESTLNKNGNVSTPYRANLDDEFKLIETKIRKSCYSIGLFVNSTRWINMFKLITETPNWDISEKEIYRELDLIHQRDLNGDMFYHILKTLHDNGIEAENVINKDINIKHKD